MLKLFIRLSMDLILQTSRIDHLDHIIIISIRLIDTYFTCNIIICLSLKEEDLMTASNIYKWGIIPNNLLFLNLYHKLMLYILLCDWIQDCYLFLLRACSWFFWMFCFCNCLILWISYRSTTKHASSEWNCLIHSLQNIVRWFEQ